MIVLNALVYKNIPAIGLNLTFAAGAQLRQNMKQIIIEKTLHGTFYENGDFLLLPFGTRLMVYHKCLGCITLTENTKENQELYGKAITVAADTNSLEIFFKINEVLLREK